MKSNLPDNQKVASVPSSHVPFGRKLAWGAGGIAENTLNCAILVLALPIYNLGLGVSAVMIGWALAVPRFMDAILDPLIGNISDNTRSRWGRRRPFIVAGAILGAFFFALLWMPPTGWSKNGLFGYFLGITIFYMVSYSVFSIPLNALGFELSEDTHERARIMAVKWFMMNGVALLFPWLYKWSLHPAFGGNEVKGVRFVGLGMAAIILISGLLPALLCREAVHAHPQPKIKVWDSLRLTLKNRAFLILFGIGFLTQFGFFLTLPMNLYIGICYICEGDKSYASFLTGIGGTLYSVAGMAVTPFVGYFSSRWGKKRTVLASIGLMALAFLSTLVTYTPAHPYWQFATSLLLCPGLTVISTLAASMLADICDMDELESGRRREGMFGAVNATLVKITLAAASVIGGYMLSISGFVDGSTHQSAETMLSMRLMYAGIPVLFLVLAALLTVIYPLTEERLKAIQSELRARAAALGGDLNKPGETSS